MSERQTRALRCESRSFHQPNGDLDIKVTASIRGERISPSSHSIAQLPPGAVIVLTVGGS